MKAVTAAALAALLAGCGVNLPTLFRVPVFQGNVVDAEKVVQLEEGMTPPQVRYLLGTPLIENDFDEHRWDYVFYLRDRNANVSKSRLSLFFEDGKLARIEGAENYRVIQPEDIRELEAGEPAEEEPEQSPPPARRPIPEPQPGPTDEPVSTT